MYEALRAVPGLRFGRTETRETEPIKPVPWAWVEPYGLRSRPKSWP